MSSNYLKLTFMLLMSIGMGSSLTSCSDENEVTDPNGVDKATQVVLENYVDAVVVPTYQRLADAALALADDCQDLSSQQKVDQACLHWVEARRYWELSEAFLFGAAADYNIDPHIDSWPLDLTQLEVVLKAGDIENRLDAGTAGYGLLGFHAVEYVIFRNGAEGDATNRNRPYSTITEAEKTYAAAVATDMAVQCVRLEASWCGVENISQDKQDLLDEAELLPSMNYGQLIAGAGLPGNAKYKTQQSALEEILVGASDIANEVGNTKIADPMASGQWSDVESPHSWNSVADFLDNIRSIRNAYYGSLDGSISPASVSSCIVAIDKAVDARIRSCIEEAIAKVDAMPRPFRNYITEKSGPMYEKIQEAIDACNELVDALDEANEIINQ